jgi:hypothetical protein
MHGFTISMNDIIRFCSFWGGFVTQCDVIMRIICISNISRFSTIKKSNFVAPSWGIDFLWFNAYYHGCSITTKSFQAKNLPNTEKRKFVFNCNKNDLDHQKAYQNLYIDQTFKQFFYISNFFRVFRCQKRVFHLVPSPYCDILVQFSYLKQQ